MKEISSYSSSRFARKLWLIREWKHAKDNLKEKTLEEFEQLSSSFPKIESTFVEECTRSFGLLHFQLFLDSQVINFSKGDCDDTTFDFDIQPSGDWLIMKLKPASGLAAQCFPANNPFGFSFNPNPTSSSPFKFPTTGSGKPSFAFNTPVKPTGDSSLEKKFAKKAPDNFACMYDEENDYSDSDSSEIHCHMIKILKNTESDNQECEVCGENIQGGHYKCYTHDYSMCAKCYFDQQYSSSDSDSDSSLDSVALQKTLDSLNSEMESEDKSGNKAINSQEIQTSKNTNKLLLQNIPCKVMNPLRKTFIKETASNMKKDIKNENVTQNLNIQIPPPSNNSRSLFLSENSELKDAEIYTYPPQMSLSTDMCIGWEDLAVYDFGKKKQAAKVANNNWGSTNGTFKNLNSMFKKQIFLSFLYQSFRDARIEFDEHNKSCNGPEKLSNEKTEIEKEEIVSCLQNKDKKTDEEVLEDYNSDIIDLKKVGGGSTFNDDESQSKMKDTEKQGEEEKGEKLSKVNLSRFSLNINIILFDGIDDYLQATYIDPSLLATTIRYHHVLDTITYFQQNSSIGPDFNQYNYSSVNNSKDKKKSNYLDGAYLYSKTVSKEGLKLFPRMTALFEKDPSDINTNNFSVNSETIMSQASVTLYSLTKALKVGGNIQYGTVRKQQMVTNSNPYSNPFGNGSFMPSQIRNDMANSTPGIAKWIPQFKPPSVFGQSPSGQKPTFNFNVPPGKVNPNPFAFKPLNTPQPPSLFSFGGGTGSDNGSNIGGSLGNKEPSDLSGKKASVVTKKMCFEDQYRLSPVTKFLGYIKISGGIYPMYNFHQCFDSRNYHASNPYGGVVNGQAELKTIFSLNNLSQFIKDRFLAKDFVEKENKLGSMEKVCTLEVVNDEIDKLCNLLEERQREREQSGNYNDSTPLWSDDADNDNADKISTKTHTFLTFLLRFLQDLENFKRYEVNGFVHY